MGQYSLCGLVHFRITVAVLLLMGMFYFSTTAGAQSDEKSKKDVPAAARNQQGARNRDDQNLGKGKSNERAAAKTVEYKLSEKIGQLLQDRNYKSALQEIESELKKPDAQADYMLFMRARTQYLAAQYDDSIATLLELEKSHSKSPWARRAVFHRAVALARKGDFQSAEKIYQNEAKRLLSLERKQEIAEIYLEFADSYFKPKDELTTKSNYAKALEFYQEALAVGPQPDRKADIELRVARCMQLLGNLDGAMNAYLNFIATHKVDAKTAEKPEKNREIEARYRLGEVYLAKNQPQDARREWQDLTSLFADEKHVHLPNAMFKIGQTHSPHNGKNELALSVAAYERFLKKYPDHKLAISAYLRIAQNYLEVGRPVDAVKAINVFLDMEKFKDKDELATARQYLGNAYQMQKKYTEAIAAWRDYLTKHPSHSAWADVQRRIIDTEYLIADEKRAEKKYNEAKTLFQEFLVKYPLDARNPRIMFLFGQMAQEQEKWDEAIASWRQLVTKYPGTEEASQAQFGIAWNVENKLHKLDEAIKEYRKVNSGSAMSMARIAVGRLTAKHMQIATERIYRSNETPKIKLQSRNLENVTVRCYRVDLETFFRKMHAIRGVEGLDIALIDPDKTFEYKVKDYLEHQLSEQDVDVPLPFPGESSGIAVTGPRPTVGAMAVTVSSKTLEATTLMLQSDLDIIVKSSRDEILVFSQNMRTGEAWPNVKVLLSNGQQVFATVETGKDGVYRASHKELKSSASVHVFAMADGHIASNQIALNGLQTARGLNDTAYIYTDRPAYRAGQVVHVRGILRHAENDEFVIKKDKKYTLEIFDPRSRSIWSEEVKLDNFGSLKSMFALPATSPTGQYRIIVRDIDNAVYTGAFIVQDYSLEPIQLRVDAPRNIYYRGEEIKGKIQLKYYYGAPIVGKEVSYQLAGAKVERAKTNDKGEIEFKYDTREYRETQRLTMNVTMIERGMSINHNFLLATQGFSLDLSTKRTTFIAGESFEMKIKALDAENKPIAQKLTMTVMKQTNVNGVVGESEVEKHEIKTDEKTGKATKTLKLGAGGNYAIRVEGIDRFDNPITEQYGIFVSDEKDNVRLRILADQHSFEVGQTAAVQIHWREEPALALVTYQGSTILDYKLLHLKKGENRFEIPLTAKLSPNFDLAVAVMIDKKSEGEKTGASLQFSGSQIVVDNARTKRVTRFYEAANSFEVQRKLNVTVEMQRKSANGKADSNGEILPGDDIEYVIKTTDSQGKPVTAQLSVAMVEQSLLAMFGGSSSPMNEIFAGTFRTSSMRTTSSINFYYVSNTRPIDKQLLAEMERKELESEENLLRESGLPFGQTLALRELDREIVAFDSPNFDVSGLADNLAWAYEGSDSKSGESRPQSESADYVFSAPLYRQSNQWHGAFNRSNLAGGEEGQVMRELQKKMYDQSADQRGGGLGGSVSGMGRSSSSRKSLVITGTPPAKWDELGKARNRYDRDSKSKNESFFAAGIGLEFEGDFDRSGNERFDAAGKDSKLSKKLGDLFNNGSVASEVNSANIGFLMSSGRRDFMGCNPTSGVQQNYNFQNMLGANFTNEMVDELCRKLNESGSMMVTQSGPQETGYWNPIVETDADGKATLTITVPEQSTAWKITTRGITTDTLAGEASNELVVKRDLFGELKLPSAVVDGDDVEIMAIVHNSVIEKGSLDVTLRTILDGKKIEEKKTVAVKSKGIQEVNFKISIQRSTPDDNANDDESREKSPAKDPLANVLAAFELTVAEVIAGKEPKLREPRTDLLRRIVPILPYGVPVYATSGGTAGGDTSETIEAPKGMTLQNPHLQVVIGPNVNRGLLDILSGPPMACHFDVLRASSQVDITTSDLMAAISLQEMFNKSRDLANPQSQMLDSKIRSCISQLVSAQLDDGSWTWTGHGRQGHRFTTSRVYWSLGLAVKAGYKVSDDALANTRNYLKNECTKLEETDFDTKAVMLHALSITDHADFAQLNRLHRNKPSLSAMALIYTALAFAENDRKAMANELLSAVSKEIAVVGEVKSLNSKRSALPWSTSGTELTALKAIALSKVAPDDPKLKELVDWLMAHRSGHRWSPEKATGPAAIAVCSWFAKGKYENEKYALKIYVNDRLVQELTVDKDSETKIIDVPDRLLKSGKERVQFQMTGRGRYTYQVVLAGFVAADKLADTTKDWVVERFYEQAPRELKGLEVPRGYDILAPGPRTIVRNELSDLPVGKRGIVQLKIRRNNISASAPNQRLEYLVVTEPLPSGVSVVESSIRGGFERFELSPGAITFYIGDRQYIDPIHFEIHGYLPGKYRVAPTMVRNAYRLDQLAVAPQAKLDVLPQGVESTQEYKMSPRELFEFGKRHFDAKEYKDALPYLTDLLAKWNLNAAAYEQTVKMLLSIHLDQGPAENIVRYFEIIKEKYPETEVPFDQIMKVGAAYDKMGEYERSYMIYRATVESSFLRENRVAGFLEAQGEFLQSVDVMQRLLGEYPPEPYTALTQYSLAQRVYAYAPRAADDPKLREKKINRITLVQQALGMLDNFMTMYPDDPAVDQAAFSLSNALLELKAHKELISRAGKYAERYPKSEYLDSFWYLMAYGHFALQDHEEALKMAKKVAESKRFEKGREIESPNKWQAIYILGQVYHSLGKAAEAVSEYLKVEDRYSDAKQAITYFMRKEIKLPEVSTLKPGEDVSVALDYRNVATVDLKVYRIDLMKFSLLKRNLAGITQINLAGIRPSHEETLKLGDGKDYLDKSKKISLPVKEEGAYLVVCRGEDLHASGLVLISPLAVEVQEEKESGRVRVTVKDVVKGKYVSQVQSKVIGSHNSEFVSGASDLRGVFIADGIVGKSTVIAQATDGRYAFFRGTEMIGPQAVNPQTAAPAQNGNEQGGQQGQQGAPQPPTTSSSISRGTLQLSKPVSGVLTEQLQRQNGMLQRGQQEYLDGNYKNKEEGVRAKSAK